MRQATQRRQFSSDALDAWAGSFLGELEHPQAVTLLEEARELSVDAGDIVHSSVTGHRPLLIVVVDGLLRLYTSSASGRQVTVRYAGVTDVVGLPTVLAPAAMGDHLDISLEAVTSARFLRIPTDRLLALVARYPQLSEPIFEELTRSLLNSYELLVENVFGSVPQRVARHLLDLAERVDGELVVSASQQSIADSIASVRAVVSRVLLQMKHEGLIARVQDAYVILAPAELHRLSRAG